MLKKKSLAPSLFFRTSTPNVTPDLSPTSTSSSESDSDEDMESSSRPVSLAVSVGAFCLLRPTLKEVLANAAPAPYTLSAFMAYLSQNHCLETLEFTLEAKRYRETYENIVAESGEAALATNDPEIQHARMLWQRLLEAYIFPGAPREINLSSEVRDALLQHADVTTPPAPETLDSAVKRMHDLMEESIFLPFLNSQSASPPMEPLSDPSLSADDAMTLSTHNLDESSVKRDWSRRKRVSPQSSTKDLPPFSGGDHGFTDDSSSPQSSPAAEEPMTPPTTPPAGDHLSMQSPRLRTDNPWKKMGMKLGFKKRSIGNPRDPKILGLDE